MRHRSPLVTVAVAALWFAVLLVANMVVHPTGGVEHGASVPQRPEPSAAGGRLASEAPGLASEPASTRTRDATSFPPEAVYVGRAGDGGLAAAVAVRDGRAIAYLCDGSAIGVWLSGSTRGPSLSLMGRDGFAVDAELLENRLSTRVRGPDGWTEHIILTPAEAPAGLYRSQSERSMNGSTTGGWIVFDEADQVGVLTTARTTVAAPPLDPGASTVSVDGRPLAVVAVTGDEEL